MRLVISHAVQRHHSEPRSHQRLFDRRYKNRNFFLKIGVYCYALQSVQLGGKWCQFNNSDNILKQNEAYHVIIAQSHTAHAAITGSD